MDTSSINALTNSAKVSYDDLIENAWGKYNVGEIVFKGGKFGKVNNSVGKRAERNAVVTTKAQNRATNAAVFKALLQQYGDKDGVRQRNFFDNGKSLEEDSEVDTLNFDEILESDNETKIRRTLKTHSNRYLVEAYKFLLCDGNDANPLSRDELRLLDQLLRQGAGKKPEQADDSRTVKDNLNLLNDLRAIKSGTKEINMANVVIGDNEAWGDDTKAEWWIKGLHVANVSKDEQRRVIALTVNKRAALSKAQRNAIRAERVFFEHMPRLVHVCEELAAREWKGAKAAGAAANRKALDAFLNKLCDGRLERGLMASLTDYDVNDSPCGKVSKAEIRQVMAKFIAQKMLQQQPSLRAALSGAAGAKLLDDLRKADDPRLRQFVSIFHREDADKAGADSGSPLEQQIQFKYDILSELDNQRDRFSDERMRASRISNASSISSISDASNVCNVSRISNASSINNINNINNVNNVIEKADDREDDAKGLYATDAQRQALESINYKMLAFAIGTREDYAWKLKVLSVKHYRPTYSQDSEEIALRAEYDNGFLEVALSDGRKVLLNRNGEFLNREDFNACACMRIDSLHLLDHVSARDLKSVRFLLERIDEGMSGDADYRDDTKSAERLRGLASSLTLSMVIDALPAARRLQGSQGAIELKNWWKALRLDRVNPGTRVLGKNLFVAMKRRVRQDYKNLPGAPDASLLWSKENKYLEFMEAASGNLRYSSFLKIRGGKTQLVPEAKHYPGGRPPARPVGSRPGTAANCTFMFDGNSFQVQGDNSAGKLGLGESLSTAGFTSEQIGACTSVADAAIRSVLDDFGYSPKGGMTANITEVDGDMHVSYSVNCTRAGKKAGRLTLNVVILPGGYPECNKLDLI